MSRLQRPSPVRALGVAAALVFAFAASTAAAAPPVWHVHGANADITLFGSVHLLDQSTEWKTPELIGDVAKADSIWFEVPIDPSAQTSAAADALKKGVLPADQTLAAILSPSAEQELAQVSAAEGVSPAALQRMKPWLAELMISLAYFQHHGAQAELGVEQQLSAAAPPSAKRQAFETVEEQIGFLADAPMKDQLESLDETLREIETDPGMFERLVSAWSRGDVAAIRKEAILPLQREAPGVYRRLLVDRNRRWVGDIERLLKTGSGHILIVVGVGHLVGPDSVPALLRKDGIKVEGP